VTCPQQAGGTSLGIVFMKNNSNKSEWVWVIYYFIIAIFVAIGIKIKNAFGWPNEVFVIVCIIGAIIFACIIGYLIDIIKTRKYLKTSCKHGIVGAYHSHNLCQKCREEDAAQEQVAKKILLEEEARIAALKEAQYQEWVRKMRTPEYLKKMDPEEFEHLVCDLFRRMGYEVENTPYVADGGIDGFLRKDGQLSILQCKRSKGLIGEPILRDLYGAMHHVSAKECVIVTTGRISEQARIWAKNKPIKMIELDELVNQIRMNFKEDDIVPKEFIPRPKNENICPICGKRLEKVVYGSFIFRQCLCGYRRKTSLSGTRRNWQ
jgi:uncharacterized integral membrane protein